MALGLPILPPVALPLPLLGTSCSSCINRPKSINYRCLSAVKILRVSFHCISLWTNLLGKYLACNKCEITVQKLLGAAFTAGSPRPSQGCPRGSRMNHTHRCSAPSQSACSQCRKQVFIQREQYSCLHLRLIFLFCSVKQTKAVLSCLKRFPWNVPMSGVSSMWISWPTGLHIVCRKPWRVNWVALANRNWALRISTQITKCIYEWTFLQSNSLSVNWHSMEGSSSQLIVQHVSY